MMYDIFWIVHYDLSTIRGGGETLFKTQFLKLPFYIACSTKLQNYKLV